ncbi:hypothetical protein [Bacillus thuringiensis]|uniref:hypothetical protein n=1 Tax=Bacillus thuringiensis TaxID=1428 RepID=UPI000BFEA1B8|nr:hypothetical protein [Bacillus thuringiensis]EKS8366762.1 hypothetical protein [Bacillus cereus]PGL18230.1 hypothetical protein CN916_29900 [Bacillus thuringiensis]
MDFLLNLFQNAVTLFVTACANELAKKLSSKRKRTALSHRKRGGSRKNNFLATIHLAVAVT